MTDTTPPLIDLHSHLVTPDYCEAAVRAGHAQPDGMPSWPTWSADAHLALMDDLGISRSILSISTPGVHFGDDAAARQLARRTNRSIADEVARRPERFSMFASLPLPDVEGAIEEARFGLDGLGAAGVAVLSNAHGVYLGDRRLDPLWAELDERRALVFVHPTSPPNQEAVASGRPRPMIEFLFDTARTVTDLILGGTLARFPRVRFLVTHGGGVLPLLADRVELFRTVFGQGDPGGQDVRTQLATLWFDTAGTPFPRQIPALTDLVGPHRVVYGSDYCWTPGPAVAGAVRSLGEWRARTTENAERLLGPTGT
jgi:6-methylsalicylate decarboxylase